MSKTWEVKVELILLGILCVLALVNILISAFKKVKISKTSDLERVNTALIKFDSSLEKMKGAVQDDLQRNRREVNEITKTNREELNLIIRQKFSDFAKQLIESNNSMLTAIKDIRQAVDSHLRDIRNDSNRKLEEIRVTVDEKLQKTLNIRLSQSFETVGKQLQSVQKGLGEMKTLAADVGGLKKVLSNVKMRGGFGEVQLSMLLEQILAPDQFESNVKTKAGSQETVEFAIKLPGRDEAGTSVWLPIDAKFPKDVYENLVDAYDTGEQDRITEMHKRLDGTIKTMARDIGSKYLNPPHTTDFGIMFLPFEGIYAEVVRKSALLEELQSKYKIIVTGPTTLAAILNSLQMGFKTLAIQKRSGEVWKVLASVKTEFGKFGGLMQKAQNNIQTGLNQLDDVMGRRTRAIERQLKDVETLAEDGGRKLPE